MKFDTISYPQEHIYYITELSESLKDIFFDVVDVRRKVLNPKELLDLPNVEQTYLKQTYKVGPRNVLRFDHTHVRMFEEQTPSIYNECTTGPVFRAQPTNKDRWRQFHSYDLDYIYDDHGYRPLKKLAKHFKEPYFKIYVNDTTLSTLLSTQEHQLQFKSLYPDLTQYTNIIVDPSLQRPAYYSGLIFEIYAPGECPKKGTAFGGGGHYCHNNTAYFGFGLGLNRILAYFLRNREALNVYLPKKKILLVYYRESIPENLLEALELKNIPYHLKRLKTSLRKSYVKDLKKLELVNRVPTHTILVSKKQDQDKLYHYKNYNMDPRYYDLDQLSELFA